MCVYVVNLLDLKSKMGRMHTPGLAIFDDIFNFYFKLILCSGHVQFNFLFFFESTTHVTAVYSIV